MLRVAEEPEIGAFKDVGVWHRRHGVLVAVFERTADSAAMTGRSEAVFTPRDMRTYLESARSGIREPDRDREKIDAERSDIDKVVRTLGMQPH